MGESYTRSPSVNDWHSLPADLWTTWKIVRSNDKQDSEAGHDDRYNEKLGDSHGTLTHRSRPPPRGAVRRLLYGIGSVLSLLLYLIPRRGRPVKTGELHPMAYLDALRGYMALIIYTMHVTNNNWHWVPDFMLKVPVFQFLVRGGYTCLTMFFFISGYVVTYRAIGFIHTKQPLKMLDTIASTVFRRYFRLFLPALPFSFFVVFGTSMGFLVPNKSQVNDGIDDMKKAFFPNNLYWWWVIDSVRELNPFADIRGFHNGAFGSRILPPLWSLCTEFRSTLMLSVFLIGTFKMPRRRRNTLIWLCIPVFFFYEADWAAMAFIGMLFADARQNRVQQEKARNSLLVTSKVEHSDDVTTLPLITTPTGQPTSEKEIMVPTSNNTIGHQIRSFYNRYEHPILYALFFYSFLIVYDPNGTERSGFFPNPLLRKIEPRWWAGRSQTSFHLCFGGLAMVYPIDRLPLLQKPLRTQFSQYLGELSFGIYVTHYVVRWIVWEPLYIKYCEEHKIEYAVPHRMMPAWLAMTICVLWASEVFRKIDAQVVVFCKWLEGRMFE